MGEGRLTVNYGLQSHQTSDLLALVVTHVIGEESPSYYYSALVTCLRSGLPPATAEGE